MSSAGQIVGGIAGGIIGFFNPALGVVMGAQLGLLAGGLIDPPKGPKIEGPRLADTSVQLSSYGTVLPRVYGNMALTGNVIWVENNRLREEKTTEDVGGKGGGGSSEQTKYTYYATFALALTDGPISAVRRIWFADTLVYDKGVILIEPPPSSLPQVYQEVISSLIASTQIGKKITIYHGTDDQQPDPRMQMTLGVANTPAYRGISYIVFNDIDLTDYGNSIVGLQVKVELVASPGTDCDELGSQNFIYVDIPYGGERESILNAVVNDVSSSVIACEHDQTWDGYIFGTRFFYLEHGVRTQAAYVSHPIGLYSGGIASGSGLRTFSRTPAAVYLISNDASQTMFEFMTVTPTGTQINPYDKFFTPAELGQTQMPAAVCLSESQGYIYLFNYLSGNKVSKVGIMGQVVEATSTVNIQASSADVVDGRLFLPYWSGTTLTLNVLDATTLAVIHSWTVTTPTDPTGDVQKNTAIWAEGATRFHVKCLNHIVTCSFNGTSWTSSIQDSGLAANASDFSSIYPLSNGEFLLGQGKSDETQTVDPFAVYYFHLTADAAAVELSTIVSAECLKAGQLTAADIDVSALTSDVFGYRISNQAAIRSSFEQLRAAYPFDMVRHGYGLKFVPRGGASVATITSEELGATTQAADPQLTTSRETATQLPGRVDVAYLDYDREYSQGDQYAERAGNATVNIRREELAIAMSAAQAAGIAEVLLRLQWLERYDLQFTLPPTYAFLEPADVITIEHQGTHEVRLTSIEYRPDGVLECVGKYNAASIYLPAATGVAGPAYVGDLGIPGSSDALFIDGPALVSDYDAPGYAVALLGFTSRWPGAILQRTDDFGATWVTVGSAVAPVCDFGNTVGALAAAATTAVFDESLTLTVDMASGELSGVTAEQVLAGQNHFIVGADQRWEIIGARSATLNEDGTYTLAGLLRGRYGTEWAMATHQAGDWFIPVAAAGSKFFAKVQPSTIGVPQVYRATTAGEPRSQTDITFTYAGANLKPYAPVYVSGVVDASGNWTLAWVRRTRVDGAWRDFVDAALSETSEAYVVEIYSSAAYTTLKRTISGLTSATATYSAANQASDFGSNQTTLYVKVYQVSSVVGNGIASAATLTASSATAAPPVFKSAPPTVLGMHFNGTNGSTTFVDEFGHTCTATGSAQLSTSQVKFGSASGLMTSGSVVVTGSSDFSLGTGDWAVEFWFYPLTGTDNGGNIISFRNGGGAYNEYTFKVEYLGHPADRRIKFGTAGTDQDTGFGSISINTWTFITVSCRGGNNYFSLGGTVYGPYNLGNPSVSAPTNITIGGVASNGGGGLVAYIDDLYLTKGVDPFAANFTPPTTEHA